MKRHATLLATLAAATLAACQTTDRRSDERNPVNEAAQRLGVSTSQTDSSVLGNSIVAAARARIEDKRVSEVYSAMNELPGNHALRTQLDTLVQTSADAIFKPLADASTARPTNTMTVRQILSTEGWAHPTLAPLYQKVDGTELVVDFPGPKSGQFTLAANVLRDFQVVNDRVLGSDYNALQGPLAHGARIMVTGRDRNDAALESALYNIATVTTPTVIGANSIQRRALDSILADRFGVQNASGDLLYSVAQVGTYTTPLHLLQTADRRAVVSSTNVVPVGADAARAYATGDGKDRHVRLVIYGDWEAAPESEQRLQTLGINRNPQNSVDPYITLGNLLAIGNVQVPNLGAGESLDGPGIVSRLFENDTSYAHMTPPEGQRGNLVLAQQQLKFTKIDGATLQRLFDSGNVRDANNNVMRAPPQCVDALTNRNYALFLE